MRILFMGTPDFAVPSLESLVAAGHTVCGVFTQPDKPRNRGMKLQAPPVKVCALAHNIPVYQPVKLRDGAALALIQELAPELIVVAAYGRILPDEILAAPPKGCINVHSSLLPNYRGAAPIHWAVLNGERETGVTIMHRPTIWTPATSSPRPPPPLIPTRPWWPFTTAWRCWGRSCW